MKHKGFIVFALLLAAISCAMIGSKLGFVLLVLVGLVLELSAWALVFTQKKQHKGT